MITSNSFGDKVECDANPWINCYIKYVVIVIYTASFDPELYISRYTLSF